MSEPADELYQRLFARYAPGVNFATLPSPVKQVLRDHAPYLQEVLPKLEELARDLEDLRNTWNALAFSSQIHYESMPVLLAKAIALLMRCSDLKWMAELMLNSARTQIVQVLPGGTVTERRSDADLYTAPLRAVFEILQHAHNDMRAVIPTLRDWSSATIPHSSESVS